MRRMICIVTACFIIMSTFTGCSLLQKLGLQDDTDETQQISNTAANGAGVEGKVQAQLYFANKDNTKLTAEARSIPLSEARKSAGSLASAIVEQLIKGPAEGSKLTPTVPKGTALKAPVTIDESKATATVNLSKEFVDKHPGGKNAIRMSIYSIVNSLTEMKEIRNVRFMIDGKTVDSFKGSFQFNTSFPRMTSLIEKVKTTAAINDNAEEVDAEAGDESSVDAGAVPEEMEGAEETFEGEDEILE